MFHLRASLEGPAGQILWDAGPQTSVNDTILLLRTRFGTDYQAERLRAELRARRRKRGESLQSLYNDVCRLMALAFPGPSNATKQVVGRDSFLDALDNGSQRVRILEHEPQTLEDALKIACRLEAYDKSAVSANVADEYDDFRGKERGRHVRPSASCPSKSRDDSLQVIVKQFAEMKSALEKDRATWNERFQQLSEAISRKNEVQAQNPETVVRLPVGTPSANSVDGGRQSVRDQSSSSTASGRPVASGLVPNEPSASRTSACFNCGDPTHWRRDCPFRRRGQQMDSSQQAQVAVISNQEKMAEIFVQTKVCGRSVMAILDTGCETSIIGSRFVGSMPWRRPI